eukprot:gene8281-biopygen9151
MAGNRGFGRCTHVEWYHCRCAAGNRCAGRTARSAARARRRTYTQNWASIARRLRGFKREMYDLQSWEGKECKVRNHTMLGNAGVDGRTTGDSTGGEKEFICVTDEKKRAGKNLSARKLETKRGAKWCMVMKRTPLHLTRGAATPAFPLLGK